jgi:hypothetical protein
MKIISTLVALTVATLCQAATLEEDFRNPPVTSRPYVWWHWMGSNFSKDGITKDLEAMKASGIGGATIFNLSSAVQESHAPTENNPWPDQTYRSPKYWEAIRHAAAEADRLGLEVGLHNTVGYSTTGGPWIDEERSMQRLVWSSIEVAGGANVALKLPVPEFKADEGWGKTGRRISFFRDIAVLAVPAGKKEIAFSEVLDLTGKSAWDAPAGKWNVYRIAHASTGRPPHPVPDDVLGKVLEADKMSLEQTRYHWATVINPLKQHLGPLLGKSFRHFLIDSYEAGDQNWTPHFREEFKKRKGYDPLPWLVTLRGSTVGSAEQTTRFNWDFHDTVATLYYENGWEPATRMIHDVGCRLQWEPYGGPFNTVEGSALADLPMGEFWTSSKGNISSAIVAAGRAAGRRVIGAEAFTGSPTVSRWTEAPAFLKLSADGAFGVGVNRLVLHHWVHQPFDDRYKPGMGMGWWGTHFGRNQTWAELGKEFYRYLGRCQALLQRGETPADYVSVGSPHGEGDVIPPRMFLNGVRVESGKIVLPSGRRYAFIHIPHDGKLQSGMVRQIKKLLDDGATVVAGKPSRSPSLAGYPACDEEVKKLADEIWDKPAGKLYTDINAAINACGITPAAQIVSRKPGDIRIQHRRDAEAEWFFVANLEKKPAKFTVSFRVADRTPELWSAETGTIEQPATWRAKDGRIEVDMSLGGVKSVFVVFRSSPTTVKQTTFKSLPAIPVAGPWTVEVAGKKLTMDKLASWSEQSDPEVKYFSGTATYRTTFKLDSVPQRMDLDLGDVRDLVRVTINGRDLGVWWHSPFARDITAALKLGENSLELAICNTWHNRLVGDEQFPADFEWGTDRGANSGHAMKAYPDWFLKNQPRPEPGRKCFVIWYYHRQDTPLIPSGLLGPVQLVPMTEGMESTTEAAEIKNEFLRQMLAKAEDHCTHTGGGQDASALFNGVAGGETADDGQTFRGYGKGDWLTLHLKQPCDITEIQTFAGHSDARASQRYTVLVAYAVDPGKFVKLATGAKQADDESEVRIPVKANNVVAVRFEFQDGPLGFNVYREINLVGVPTKKE